MNRIIRLIKGEVYYYCTFYDNEFTYPQIQTLVYDGIDKEYGHLFKNLSDDNTFYSFPIGEIQSVFDKQALSEWVLLRHNSSSVRFKYEYIEKNL